MKTLLLLIILFSWNCSSIDLTKYEALKTPRITTKASQKVFRIEITGDPNKVAGKAYSRIYKAAFKSKENDLGRDKMIPRARWPKPLETPIEEYIGIYASPVSEKVNSIPEGLDNPEPKLVLETWEYGEVAEILHIGSYEKEMPTVEKLKSFVKEKGYEIDGPHEEEYLKGPGMFFKGNEDEYVTIIRYKVKPLKKK
ncbi:MAG: GyrI-like domain-containing protein [Leptospiraceae bacterium]|nr:GyrI-like domain-containing protein [Leptospiraceae bacterium]